MAAKKPTLKIKNVNLTAARGALVIVSSVIVAILICGSLWVVATAMIDRINTSRGVNQIIDVVDLSRQAASTERDYGANAREDLLLRLNKTRQITTTGDADGLKTVTNPWGGNVVAYTTPGNMFRVESNLPSHNCEHILDLLTQNISSLGLRQIDAKETNESWQQIYSAQTGRDIISNQTIAAGCHHNKQVVLALTFILR